MSWVTVSREDLKMYVVSALVEAIDSAALGDAQLDRFTQVHADTIAEVRVAAKGKTSNVLDSDPAKIPQSLRSAACWIICQYMAQGLGVEMTEAQLNEVTQARQRLSDVARGDVPVEVPDSPDTTPDVQTAANAVQLVRSSTRVYTRESMAGL